MVFREETDKEGGDRLLTWCRREGGGLLGKFVDVETDPGIIE